MLSLGTSDDAIKSREDQGQHCFSVIRIQVPNPDNDTFILCLVFFSCNRHKIFTRLSVNTTWVCFFWLQTCEYVQVIFSIYFAAWNPSEKN